MAADDPFNAVSVPGPFNAVSVPDPFNAVSVPDPFNAVSVTDPFKVVSVEQDDSFWLSCLPSDFDVNVFVDALETLGNRSCVVECGVGVGLPVACWLHAHLYGTMHRGSAKSGADLARKVIAHAVELMDLNPHLVLRVSSTMDSLDSFENAENYVAYDASSKTAAVLRDVPRAAWAMSDRVRCALLGPIDADVARTLFEYKTFETWDALDAKLRAAKELFADSEADDERDQVRACVLAHYQLVDHGSSTKVKFSDLGVLVESTLGIPTKDSVAFRKRLARHLQSMGLIKKRASDATYYYGLGRRQQATSPEELQRIRDDQLGHPSVSAEVPGYDFRRFHDRNVTSASTVVIEGPTRPLW